LSSLTKIKTMKTTNEKIVLLDYSNADVVVLENIPSQKYIDDNHNGDWEDWLYTIQKDRDDIPCIKDCHYMNTSKFAIKTIEL